MGLAAGVRLGPYAVEAPIGTGGMGEIYRARDTRLDRVVAIKVMPASVADSPTRRQRFEREARAISALSHSHICALFDVGEQDGIPYLVMEHLEGETLAARLVRGALPMDQVLRYAIEIADALDHAHRQGIIHRDLKPANVMITRSGVKLLDFGIAKLRAPDAPAGASLAVTRPSATLTEEGTIVGTPLYMAPEQLHGHDVDARIDLFAFGAVVHEMATGRAVFEGPSHASIIAAVLERNAASLSTTTREAPRLLDRIIARCLAKHPDDRWQTASDLRQALEWAADRTLQSDHVPPPVAASPGSRGWLWFAVAALGLLVLAAIALTIGRSHRAPDQALAVRFIVPPPENTSFSQSSAFMALSPDGHSLAFLASAPRGGRALWIRSLDSLIARPLPMTDDAGQPFWSPDGRFIAVMTVGTGALKKIDVATGAIQTLVATPAGHGTWSRDGVILFQRTAAGGPIYRVAAGGGSATRATVVDAGHGETGHTWPEFLPDGRHFLFLVRSTQPEHDGILHIGSLDATDRVPLVRSDSHAVYAPAGYLLFMRANTLLAQPFNPSTLRFTGEPVPVAEQVERTAASRRGAFSVAENGVLAYRPLGDTRLGWYDRSGRMLQPIGPPGHYSNPALSPDEQRIAIGRLDPETGAPDIWIIDLARGGLASRITSDAVARDMPLWSPDGMHIVFKSGSGFEQRPADGTGDSERLLAGVGVNANPLDWADGGRSLLYHGPEIAKGSQSRFRLDIWTLPINGDRRPVAVLKTEFQKAQARLSRDGRWMAYVSDETGRYEVYVRAFPSGEGKRQVSTEGGMEPQ